MQRLILTIIIALALVFTLSCSGDNAFTAFNFTDLRDGEEYKYVEIGQQVWMAENLNYEVEGSACYENNAKNCAKYGRLYDWETAMKVCPDGWHLPSNEEWNELYYFVDDSVDIENIYISGTETLYHSPTAGKYLKDSYGFAALPGGYGISSNDFRDIGNIGFWWSASEYNYNDTEAYLRGMSFSRAVTEAYWVSFYKTRLHSVRCLKDK